MKYVFKVLADSFEKVIIAIYFMEWQ